VPDLEREEKEWIKDEFMSKRMQVILDEVKKMFPGEELSEYEERAKNNYIPNPFVLEKKDRKPLIFMAGLIHREYAVTLLLGVITVKITEDGRAIVQQEGREIDVTEDVLSLIPQLISACALSIKDLSIIEEYEKEINELLNIISLSLYMSIALKSPVVLEKLLLMVQYAINNARSEKIRKMVKDRTVKELKELGLEELAGAFSRIAE